MLTIILIICIGLMVMGAIAEYKQRKRGPVNRILGISTDPNVLTAAAEAARNHDRVERA